MSKYILFNDENKLVARYDSDINNNIPTSALPVSDEIFFRTIRENDGIWALEGSDIVKLPIPEPTIEQQKELVEKRLKSQIVTLESKQPRALRELALNPNDSVAKVRLQDIESEITTLRSEIERISL